MKKIHFPLSFLACFLLCFTQIAQAQTARLGIQGILKKANGNAVDDGTYNLTFKLYTVADGGSAIWTEVQPDVDVVGGIYTATLGSITALNVPFNQTYYLGVSVGATAEMLPRIQLTTAPYALSLIGNTNQFPSSGVVRADSIRVSGGIRTRGGTPGANGVNRNGYAFQGGTGDSNGDSGLFSTAEGQASLYSNNVELLRVSGGGVGGTISILSNATVSNSLTINDQLIVNGRVSDLILNQGKHLSYYNGSTTYSDWRLVHVDEFTSGGGVLNWFATADLTTTVPRGIENVSYNPFNGFVIRPTQDNQDFLKKHFDLSGVGAYTQIKVKFKYYFTDSWDADDSGIGGFALTADGDNPAICWVDAPYVYSTSGIGTYTGATNFSDAAKMGEMVANTSITDFYLFFSMRAVDGDINNERFAISNIEIWVR